MDDTTTQQEFKIMSQDDFATYGWVVPSFKQLSENMDIRLKKVRGDDVEENNFLIRHNYMTNSARTQA